MEFAPDDYVIPLPINKIESLLNLVSSYQIDFMVFVGNNNCLQIHTGKANQILRTGSWINILDNEFNLHLNDQEIKSLWLVKKPTDLGLIHSFEAFDQHGNLIIQFFGKRKPHVPEDQNWRRLLHELIA